MEFGSSHAYVNSSSDDEDDLELDEQSMEQNIAHFAAKSAQRSKAASPGLLGSIGNAFSSAFSRKPKPPAAPASVPRSAVSRRSPAPGISRKAANTNVVAIKFGSLAQDSEIFPGDPVMCGKCHVALSATSTVISKEELAAKAAAPAAAEPVAAAPGNDLALPSQPMARAAAAPAAPVAPVAPAPAPAPAPEAAAAAPAPVSEDAGESGDGSQVWVCEFCSHRNFVDVDQEEIPKVNSVDYVLEPAPEVAASAAVGAGGEADTDVIFVIDVSGSMCVTTEVKGKFALKGAPRDNAADFDIAGLDGQAIPMPGQGRNVTWVSRLQCVQAAVDSQLDQWAKTNPERRVGLVTFNRDVTIIGDGSGEPEVVTGDKLMDQEKLQAIGNAHSLASPLKTSGAKLSKQLWALEETGPTALGPALLVAVTMASKKNGTRVVVCTDGLANVGVGALDGAKEGEERQKVEAWYEGVGNLAKLSGVVVSVVSIKGDECALEDLGRVTTITGGDVNRVDPLELTTNFSAILSNPVLATHVNAVVDLHQALRFRQEAPEVTTRLEKEIGNVCEDTEIAFEYAIDRAALAKFRHLATVPFQVQVRYTKLNGMKCLRVISKAQPLTHDRHVAEKEARVELLAACAAQQSARLAEKGNFSAARLNNARWGASIQSSAAVSHSVASPQIFRDYVADMGKFDQSIQQQAQTVSRLKASRTPVRSSVYASAPQQQQQQQYAPGAPPPPPSAAAVAGFSDAIGEPLHLAEAEEAASSEDDARLAKTARNDAQYLEIKSLTKKKWGKSG